MICEWSQDKKSQSKSARVSDRLQLRNYNRILVITWR